MDSNWMNNFTGIMYNIITEDSGLIAKCLGKGINEVNKLIKAEYGIIDDGLPCLQAGHMLQMQVEIGLPIYWNDIAHKIVELDEQGGLEAKVKTS